MAGTVQTLSLCTIHILRYVQLAVERYVMIPSREYNKKKKRKEKKTPDSVSIKIDLPVFYMA